MLQWIQQSSNFMFTCLSKLRKGGCRVLIGKIFINLLVPSSKLRTNCVFFLFLIVNSRTTLRLLRGGVPVTIRDGFKQDESTLHWACSFSDIEVAKLLLLSGIPVDITNKDGQTSLHLACKAQKIEMIKLLLSEGASTKSVDNSGKMPKDLVLQTNDEIESLLNNPPEPTHALKNIYLKSQLASCTHKDASESAAAALAAAASVVVLAAENDTDITAPAAAERTPSTSHQVLETSRNGNHLAKNGSSSSHNYNDRDAHGSAGKAKIISDDRKESPLLVLWPPARRQARKGQETLDLNSRDAIQIHLASDTIDILPILGRSGLLDLLTQFNFRTNVKRSASGAPPSAPMIQICVDSGLCPGRHRFEIEVSAESISVLASDRQGGLYGIYALTQLLQLHSEVKYSEDGDVVLSIPTIALSDWPDVMNRAVMWSFRSRARANFQYMRETLELLSRLRIDMVLFVIDTTSIEDAAEQEEIESKIKGAHTEFKSEVSSDRSAATDGQDPHKSTSSHITALDEISEGLCVELIPTMVITSVTERLSLSLLKSFSNTMMCVLFNFDLQSVRKELSEKRLRDGEGVVTDTECDDACKASCEAAFHAATLIGYSAILYSCTKWVRTVANPRVRTLQLFGFFF